MRCVGGGLIGAALTLVACADEPLGRAVPPELDAAAVLVNEHNVLSAIVSVRARHADHITVRYRLFDAAEAAASETPAVPITDETAAIPVLGLLPESRYVMRPLVSGAGGTVTGDALELTTGALPSDLPSYVASGLDPSPGYVLFAAGKYAVVIDNAGRVVWYRYFPNGAGLNFMAQPTGRYVLRPPAPDPAAVAPWVELDPLGNVTRTLSCALGLRPRLHDILLEEDGNYWILCDETRSMDLTAFGGVPDAGVTGTVVQHVDADGALLFHWSPFDHFEITDLDPAALTGATVNWTHGNAIDIDRDGNLIVSFRSLDEITKIDGRTGAVIWRMGGRRNEFTFLDTPTPAFAHQHGARAYAPGALLLLDNLGDPAESRAEHYVVDDASHTARLAQSYGSTPAVVTQLGGSVQDLGGGRTLVSFGTAGRVEEYDAAGRVMWRIEGNPGYVFRAERILSLYTPGVGTAR